MVPGTLLSTSQLYVLLSPLRGLEKVTCPRSLNQQIVEKGFKSFQLDAQFHVVNDHAILLWDTTTPRHQAGKLGPSLF